MDLFVIIGIILMGSFIAHLIKEKRSLLIGFHFLVTFGYTTLLLLYLGIQYNLTLLNLIAITIIALTLFPILLYYIIFIVSLLISGSVLIKREGFRLTYLLSFLLAAALLSLLVVPLLSKSGKLGDLGLSLLLYIATIIIYFLFIFVIFIVSSFINLFAKKGRHYDYIVVLGSGLNKDQLTPLLRARVDKALHHYKLQKGNPKLICSGGQGRDELISEGQAMFNYAKTIIDEDNIIIEGKSLNTMQNLLYSRELMDQTRPVKVLVVTSNYHLFRALQHAKRIHMKCDGAGSRTKFYFWMNATIREFIGSVTSYWKMHVFIVICITLFWLLTTLISY